MKFKTIIVEDEEISRKALKQMVDEIPWLEFIGEASTFNNAVDLITLHKPDVLFLDIKIPGGTGLEVLEKVGKIPHIIFTTAYGEYAVDAFDHNAVDYLLKPFSKRRFYEAIDKIRSSLFDPSQSIKIFVRTGNKLTPVTIDQVDYFEADGDYVIAHSGEDEKLLSTTLKALEGQLNGEQFIRTHRSHIVNLHMISSLKKYANRRFRIKFRNGKDIFTSRAGATKLRNSIQ